MMHNGGKNPLVHQGSACGSRLCRVFGIALIVIIGVLSYTCLKIMSRNEVLEDRVRGYGSQLVKMNFEKSNIVKQLTQYKGYVVQREQAEQICRREHQECQKQIAEIRAKAERLAVEITSKEEAVVKTDRMYKMKLADCEQQKTQLQDLRTKAQEAVESLSREIPKRERRAVVRVLDLIRRLYGAEPLQKLAQAGIDVSGLWERNSGNEQGQNAIQGQEPPKPGQEQRKSGQEPPQPGQEQRQEPPKTGQELAKTDQEPPKTGQEPPKTGQEPPKTGQEPPKTGQEQGQEPPKTGQEPPKTGQEPPKPGQEQDKGEEPPKASQEPPKQGQEQSKQGQEPPKSGQETPKPDQGQPEPGKQQDKDDQVPPQTTPGTPKPSQESPKAGQEKSEQGATPKPSAEPPKQGQQEEKQPKSGEAKGTDGTPDRGRSADKERDVKKEDAPSKADPERTKSDKKLQSSSVITDDDYEEEE